MNMVLQALNVAVKHHQQGDLREAERIYRQILHVDPHHVGALHLLGLIAHQVGKNDMAIDYMTQAVRLNPNYHEAHNNLGIVLKKQGRVAEAVTHHQQALSLRPDWAEAHNNLGLALKEQGRLEEAIACFQRAIRQRPNYAEAHNNQGNALMVQGKLHEAIGCYQEAIRQRPNYADAHNNLGIALKEQRKLDEAAASFQQAVQLRPDYAEAHNNLGVVLMQQRNLDEAVASFRQAVRLRPSYAEAHGNLGVVLMQQRNLDEAVATLQRAIDLRVDYAEAHSNLGVVLMQQGKLEEAVTCLQQAVRLKPDYAEAHNNLANALQRQLDLDEALVSYQEALRLKPDYAEAHWNRALAWLLMGDFERGWPEYEWRWKTKENSLRPFRQPLWDGSTLGGRTILLHVEQGLGDTLQFVRYAPLVKARGGKVIVECQQALLRLLASCPGIDQLVAQGSALPEFDFHAPLLSLLQILGTRLATVPADVPYLSAAAGLVEHWRQELGSPQAFKIGIAWQGFLGNPRDRERSAPLVEFALLARVAGVQLVSLQKGPGSEQLSQAADRLSVIDMGAKTSADFMDTAAVMKNMELVIAVDTAVAHLAGALGMPVWLALPFSPTWRWLLDREDSPWYPTMRLFRQTERGNWRQVFERMAAALHEAVKQKPR
jgi:tetratricopeptide (TPR) repeat protein